MTVIEISGEIGWEVTPEDVSEQLKASKGDDLMVRLSTIGGNTFKGGDILVLLSNHKRDNPKIKMHLEIGAVAASMGSAIAAAPIWESIGIDSTTAFMIHNPSSFVYGDYRTLEQGSKMMSDMREVYIQLYTNRTKKNRKIISDMMDNETWFFGQAIIDNGFADKIITINDEGGLALFEEDEKIEQNETIIILDMKAKYQELQKKIAMKSDSFELEKAVACLKAMPKIKKSTAKADDIKPAHKVGDHEMEVPEVETKTDLMKELPEVYAESKADGVKEERERVSSLMALKQSDEYKDIPEVVAAIEKGIEEGKTIADTQTAMNAAMVKIMKDPSRMAAIESPGDIQGGDMVIEDSNVPVAKSSHLEA